MNLTHSRFVIDRYISHTKLLEKSILKEFSNLSANVANVLKEIIRDDFELDELSTILKKLYVLSGKTTAFLL